MKDKSRNLRGRDLAVDWDRFRSGKSDHTKDVATSAITGSGETPAPSLLSLTQQLHDIKAEVEHLSDLVAATLTTAAPSPVKTLLSVDEFCARNHISRSQFFHLKRTGKGPRHTKPGKEILISLEAEEEWRIVMEITPTSAKKSNSQDKPQ